MKGVQTEADCVTAFAGGYTTNMGLEDVTDALERLSEIARAGGTDWALGVEARSRALLSKGEAAERLYGEAIARLSRTRLRAELGRAHLLFGECVASAGASTRATS
jgi:hypothetical protein